MSKLYACIISEDAKKDADALTAVAHEFAYSMERIEDGILFDVSGLQKLVGTPAQISNTPPSTPEDTLSTSKAEPLGSRRRLREHQI